MIFFAPKSAPFSIKYLLFAPFLLDYFCLKSSYFSAMTLEEKVAILTERVNELEQILKHYRETLGLVKEELPMSIYEVKLSEALQKKPLLTRQEVMISLGIGPSTLDKWSIPLTEEEEKRGDRVYLPPVKTGGRTYYYLTDLKEAFRKQRGDVEGFRAYDELHQNGGFLEPEERDVYLRLLAEKLLSDKLKKG